MSLLLAAFGVSLSTSSDKDFHIADGFIPWYTWSSKMHKRFAFSVSFSKIWFTLGFIWFRLYWSKWVKIRSDVTNCDLSNEPIF